MELISINVGKPKEVIWKNRSIITSIFKDPVIGKQSVSFLNINGDKQSDLTVHGGVDKAIYAYASEHYKYWKELYPDKELNFGMFGENLTIKGGLFENKINIGDCFRIGTLEVMVVQPRMPCFKLGLRFGTEKVIKQFMQSDYSGIYFRVLKEGEIDTGCKVEQIKSSNEKLSVLDVYKLFSGKIDISVLEKAAYHPDIADGLKEYFQERLANF